MVTFAAERRASGKAAGMQLFYPFQGSYIVKEEQRLQRLQIAFDKLD
jgi:hypothetical protein